MKLRGIVPLALMVSCIPLTALASDVTIVNSDGKFTSDAARTTLTLSGSLLTGISGLAAFGIPDQSSVFSTCQSTGCLGKASLMTGPKTSGFLLGTKGAVFGSGGTFTVTGAGYTFTGALAAGATWTCLSGACNQVTGGTWTFSGTVMNGTLTVGGHTFIIPTAGTIQLTTVNGVPTGLTGQGLTWTDAGGTTSFAAPVPEPGTLLLVGTGLVGLASMARRRMGKATGS